LLSSTKISLAFWQSCFTSLSFKYSHRFRRSICTARKGIDGMTRNASMMWKEKVSMAWQEKVSMAWQEKVSMMWKEKVSMAWQEKISMAQIKVSMTRLRNGVDDKNLRVLAPLRAPHLSMPRQSIVTWHGRYAGDNQARNRDLWHNKIAMQGEAGNTESMLNLGWLYRAGVSTSKA